MVKGYLLRLPHGFPGLLRIIAGLLQPRPHCAGGGLKVDIPPYPAELPALANALLRIGQPVRLVSQPSQPGKELSSQRRPLTIRAHRHL